MDETIRLVSCHRTWTHHCWFVNHTCLYDNLYPQMCEQKKNVIKKKPQSPPTYETQTVLITCARHEKKKRTVEKPKKKRILYYFVPAKTTITI